MLNTPHVKHWLPTRMYKFKKFHNVIQRMQALDNVVVRLSSDAIDGSLVNSNLVSTNSTIVPENALESVSSDVKICSAYYQDGKCLTCTDCYDKSINTIGYVGHGKAMTKNQSKLINTVSI